MKHFHENIQGWFCPEAEWLYRWRVEQAPSDAFSRFVEIGSWKGRSAAFMAVEIANSEKPITFYCVDHWKGSNEPEHLTDPDLKNIYKIFRSNLDQFGNVIPMKMASVDAAKVFSDRSLDFVFIDGSHEYQNVVNDINSWWPKVKEHGVFAGDDWGWPEVRQAVSEKVASGVAFGNIWYTAGIGGVTPQRMMIRNYA